MLWLVSLSDSKPYCNLWNLDWLPLGKWTLAPSESWFQNLCTPWLRWTKGYLGQVDRVPPAHEWTLLTQAGTKVPLAPSLHTWHHCQAQYVSESFYASLLNICLAFEVVGTTVQVPGASSNNVGRKVGHAWKSHSRTWKQVCSTVSLLLLQLSMTSLCLSSYVDTEKQNGHSYNKYSIWSWSYFSSAWNVVPLPHCC